MIGPRKLILLGSARYGYAEIDLERPIHIVAGNNMGKTSIINALQFLYVDDERSMNFGENDRLKTRRHYFDGDPGMIIFECQAPRRRMLVGVRSAGAIDGFAFERWCCEGEYDRDLFLQADGLPRPWREVQADLATFRKFTPLKPRELRQALTGTGTVPNLGLVPLRPNVDFELFRERFVDILHLTQVDAEDLKKSIIGICRGEGTFQEEVDLAGTYSEIYQAARRDRRAAEEFEKLLPEITNLSAKITSYQDSLPKLVREWRSIDQSHKSQLKHANDHIVQIRDQISGLGAKIEQAEIACQEAQSESRRATSEHARLSHKVEDLQSRQQLYGHHIVSDLEQNESAAIMMVTSLEAALQDAASEGLAVASRRVDQAKFNVMQAQKALSGLDSPVLLDWLHQRQFSKAEIETISKIANRDLLMLELDSEFAIENDDDFEEQLRTILQAVQSDRLFTRNFEADISQIGPIPTERPNRDSIESDLRRAKSSLASAETALAAVQERSSVEKQLNEAKSSRSEISKLLAEVRRLNEDIIELPELQSALRKAEDLEFQTTSLLAEKTNVRDDIRQHGHKLRRELNDAEEDRSRILDALKYANLTEDDRIEGDAGEIESHAFDARLKDYRSSRSKFEDLRSFIASSHADLSRHLHTLPTDYDLMAEALEEAEIEGRAKIESAGKAWKTLLGTLTTSIRRLKESYATVERHVDGLNSNLRDVKVSDLEHIRFRLGAKRSDLDMLDEFLATRASDDDMFLNREAQADADRRVEAMLQRGRLRVIDMFTLGVEVDKNGTTMRYSSLDKIESNGTGITIKIVMGLLILKSLLRIEGQRIPFYIDETGTLDDDNLREIIKFGLENKFIAILASPDPKASTPVHYFPERHGGRSWIMPHHRIERVSESALVNGT